MKRLWIVDLALALLFPALEFALAAAVVGYVAASDPDEYHYYLWIEPLYVAPLVVAFLAAAAWSYMRPAQALRAQLIPGAVVLVDICSIAYGLATFTRP